jgi:hypothetical protein
MGHHLQDGLENPLAKVCQLRLTVIEFARLILYWQAQGEIFSSRAQMLQETVQVFLREHKVRELTFSEAALIEADEYSNYQKEGRQVAVQKIVSKFKSKETEAMLRRLEEVKSQETPITLEDLIDD